MGDYLNLREFLKTAGEDDLPIVKLYVIRIGCFAFSAQQLPDHSADRPISALEEILRSLKPTDPKDSTFSELVLDELKNALESHANVFGVEADSKDTISATLGPAQLIRGNAIQFQVNLPERLQRFKSALGSQDQNIEQIGVVTNGSLYACYAEVETFSKGSWFAQEYRELFQELLEKRKKIYPIALPPCPIHPAIWVAVLPDNVAPKKILHIKGNDLIFLLPHNTKIKPLVRLMLSSFSFELEKFFRICLEDRSISLYETEIFNEFAVLTDSFRDILKKSWWRVIDRHKLWVAARTSLSNIHLRLVEYGSALAEYERQIKDYPSEINKESEIACWSDYFCKQFGIFSIPQFLTSSLQYFERELQLFGHKRVILIASSIAATVSAIISILIAILRNK
ncbi:MAG: hypothetical protein WCE73_02655 [Candidatus Angelobacter sp.]